MERLVADTGESAFLGVATPSFEIRYVAKVVSANPLRYDVELDVAATRALARRSGRSCSHRSRAEALDDYFAITTSRAPQAARRSSERACAVRSARRASKAT